MASIYFSYTEAPVAYEANSIGWELPEWAEKLIEIFKDALSTEELNAIDQMLQNGIHPENISLIIESVGKILNNIEFSIVLDKIKNDNEFWKSIYNKVFEGLNDHIVTDYVEEWLAIEKELAPVTVTDSFGNISTKVPLILFGNYPGAQTPSGKSLAGHAWIGGVDEKGNSFSRGARPGGIIDANEVKKSFCPETVYFVLWVTPAEQELAINAMNREWWTPWDNCIDHVVSALDAIKYPHPDFKGASEDSNRVSDPISYCKWVYTNYMFPKHLQEYIA